MARYAHLAQRAYEIRRLSILSTTAAGSGHVTSCLSCADILAVLFFHVMKFDPYDMKNVENDRFILSKGHAAPALYAVWQQLGMLTEAELLQMRSITSPLEGHPTWRFSLAEAATGSLGIGLSIADGMALFAQRFACSYRTYVLLGDSEMSEGSVWEALEFATFAKLPRLTAIIDVNGLGQQGPTRYVHALNGLKKRCEAFGWKVFEVDGHSLQDLVNVFDMTKTFVEPVMILAKTVKGYGLSIEGQEGYHGKALSKEQAERELVYLNKRFADRFNSDEKPYKPESLGHDHHEYHSQNFTSSVDMTFLQGVSSFSARKSFGTALHLLAQANKKLLVFDAEVSNSTFTEIVKHTLPQQFVECYIAEQNMIGMAIGANLRGAKVVVATFAAFLTRAHDQLRMSVLSATNMTIVGTHAGSSIGQDGASQMGLEDIAMMRTLPGCFILYPSDGVSAARCTALCLEQKDGNSYLRVTRDELPILYSIDEEFVIGGSKVLRVSKQDSLVIFAAGITVHESLRAQANLRMRGIHVAVIDVYSIYPLDLKQIRAQLERVGGNMVVVEDHYQAGGLGEAIFGALAGTAYRVKHLYVSKIPHSGPSSAVMAQVQIDARAIEIAVYELLNRF